MDGRLACSTLLLTLVLTGSRPAHAAATPASAVEQPSDKLSPSGPAAPALSPEQLASDQPPPTPYDMRKPEPPPVADPNLVAQLGRTIMALVLVIALIYLCAKLLPRFTTQWPRQRGGTVVVRERVQLDAKHAVFLLEIAEGRRLLVGTGEGGIRLVTELAVLAPDSAFRGAMEDVSSEKTGSGGAGSQQGDRNVKAN